jgi:hypothetical protein
MEQSLEKDTGSFSTEIIDLQNVSMGMNGWLKFLGIINIISGALTALSVVGVIIAWLPIWLGILLLQAGGQAVNAKTQNDPRELVKMMEKLRLYFILQGIVFIIMIAFVIIGLVFVGGFLTQISDFLQDY